MALLSNYGISRILQEATKLKTELMLQSTHKQVAEDGTHIGGDLKGSFVHEPRGKDPPHHQVSPMH